MFASDKPVVIAGGGLGGLTAALALAQKGVHVRVLEQAPQFGAIGYGIQLGPNVFKMFERLGIREDALARTFRSTGLRMIDAFSGKSILHIPTDEAHEKRFGHPYAVIHRVDLHEVLLDACRANSNIEMTDSVTVTGFEDLPSGVRVFYGDGQAIDGALLIGADGLRSRIRAALVGDGEPQAIGYAAHRTLLPMSEVPEHLRSSDVVLWSGPSMHIVHYPLRRGELFNLVAVFKTPRYDSRDTPDILKHELLETYAATHPNMRALLELMTVDRRWPITDRDPTRKWNRGHVCLLGDAAHPTSQSLAQGAGMAIEDGVYIASALAENAGNLPAALERYTRGRYLRTARVQLESRQLWEFYHLEDPIAIEVRNQQQSEMTTDDYYKCLNWLWAGI